MPQYFNFLLNKLNFCCGNYSRAETICGNTVFLFIPIISAGDSGANQTPLWLGDDLEFWPEKSNAKERLRFVKIASLSTELIAVSEKGILYQWRWSDMTPHRHDNPNGNHPRSAGLGLTSEKVVKISASNIRYLTSILILEIQILLGSFVRGPVLILIFL